MIIIFFSVTISALIDHFERSQMQSFSPPLFAAVAVVAVVGLSNQAQAQSQDVTELEAVVVTASGFEQNISDAPASISVISQQELGKKSYTNIMDAVRDIPGLYVTGGGGSQDISIRGMDDSYTLYMIDGKPVSAGRSVNTNGADEGKQIAMPPLAMIERVEVIRGPMSSLYGSEAMGGVVNIITRKAGDRWAGSVATEYTHSMNDLSNDQQQVNLYAAGPLIPGVLNAQVNASWAGTEESDYIGGDDNAESTPESTRKKGGIKLTWTLDERNELAASINNSKLDYSHTPGKSYPLDSDPFSYEYEKDIYYLSHQGNYGKLLLNTFLQQDTSERVQDLTKKEEVTTLNSQASYFGDKKIITFGGQYKYEDFTDETNGLLTSGVAGAVRSTDRWIGAVFGEVEWELGEALKLTTGLRYNDDELFGGHLSPRIYANYQLNPDWTLKGGISTGYKQPGLAEATAGFGRGTGGSGSPAPHPRALIIGNPDLEPETSTSYEAGFTFKNDQRDLSASLMLFHTRFEDKIAESRLCESANGDRNDPATWTCGYEGTDYLFLSTRENIDEAEMQGVELSFGYGLTQNVNLHSSYTYTESEQKTGEFAGQPLNKIPKHMLNATVDWQANDKLNVWAQGNYRGKTSDYLTRTSMSEGTPSYGFINAGLVYELNPDVNVKAGIYNLLNKEVTNESYGVVLDGRRFNVGLTVDF